MSELKLQLIEVVEDLTKARIKLVQLEAKFAGLLDRVTGGTSLDEKRKAKFKRDAAPAKVKSIQKKTDSPEPDSPKPPAARSPVKQKIIDVLSASTVPLSIAVIADRAGATTTNTYYHLSTLREEGTVRLFADGYELVAKAQKEAA